MTPEVKQLHSDPHLSMILRLYQNSFHVRMKAESLRIISRDRQGKDWMIRPKPAQSYKWF